MKGLCVDTGFLIRFVKSDEKLNQNAEEYYRYCLERQIPIYCSTIAIAEYCVKGQLNQLPLKDLRVIPFNINHAARAGDLMRITFAKRNKSVEEYSRVSATNDVKMFAQVDIETTIDTFLTVDQEAIKLYNSIKTEASLQFQIIDLNIPRHIIFGELDLS